MASWPVPIMKPLACQLIKLDYALYGCCTSRMLLLYLTWTCIYITLSDRNLYIAFYFKFLSLYLYIVYLFSLLLTLSPLLLFFLFCLSNCWFFQGAYDFVILVRSSSVSSVCFYLLFLYRKNKPFIHCHYHCNGWTWKVPKSCNLLLCSHFGPKWGKTIKKWVRKVKIKIPPLF